MDRKAVSFFVVGLLSGLALACGLFVLAQRQAPAGAQDRLVLKLAHSLDPSHPVHAGMEFMAKRMAELSGGRVEMQIFPSGQLGSETENIEQLQRGALAICKTSTASLENFIPEMAVFGLPYLFRDEAHAWRVLDGPLGDELLAKGGDHGLRGLCYFDAGARSFYTVGSPILTPDDLRGRKIRVLASRTAMDMITAMGGAPTPIPWGELYTALQQSMVDGAENNPPSFLSSRHFEVCKQYSLDEHTRVPDILLISRRTFDALEPQVQQWLLQAADEASQFQRKLWHEETERALVALAEAGVTIHRPDSAPFVERVQPLYEAVRNTPVGRLVDAIRSTP